MATVGNDEEDEDDDWDDDEGEGGGGLRGALLVEQCSAPVRQPSRRVRRALDGAGHANAT